MIRTLAAAAALWAAFLLPASGQQVACVPDAAAADEAARNAGEELAFEGETSGGVGMRFYISPTTWTVFFERNGQWCTAPSMVGKIHHGNRA
ncbi:MAG: hypothetical protein EBT12_09720 [Marivivens sp.]|nr:hypothetical protein [Marivivens sp.]NBT51813.1 hypothetical protein [Marivivens sp.]